MAIFWCYVFVFFVLFVLFSFFLSPDDYLRSKVGKTWLLFMVADSRTPRGSQSGREKKRDWRKPGWKLSSRLFSRPARLTAPRSPRMGCRGTRQCFAQKPLFVHQNLTFERNSKFVCYYYSLSLLRSCFRTKSAKWTNFLRTYAPSVLTLSPSGKTKRLTVISK